MFNLSEASIAADQLAQATFGQVGNRLSPYPASTRSELAVDVARAMRVRSAYLRRSLLGLGQALLDRLHDSHNNTAASPRA